MKTYLIFKKNKEYHLIHIREVMFPDPYTTYDIRRFLNNRLYIKQVLPQTEDKAAYMGILVFSTNTIEEAALKFAELKGDKN